MSLKDELDEIAERYHLASDVTDMPIENLVQEYEIEWMKSWIRAGDSIVELGLGDGVTMRSLTRAGSYTLIEGSQKLAAEARKICVDEGISATIYESLFEEWSPQPDKLVDVIIASHVLEHVSSPRALLDHLASWLSPQGRMLIIVPNSESIHRRLGVAMGLQERLDDLSVRDHLVGHLRVYDLQTLREEVLGAQLEIVEECGFFLKPLSNAQLLTHGLDVIEGLCRVGMDLSPRLLANLGLVVQKTSNE